MSRLTRLLTTAAALAVLHGCDKATEPTLSDPVRMIGSRAWFVHPDGRPASGASFKLLARSSTASDSIATASGVLDAEGRSQLKIPEGNYSLVVNDPAYGYSGWIDSVFASGDSLLVKTDTLRISGEIRGRIRVQPGSSPRIAWIHIAHTDLFSNIGEDGRFRIGRVPAGRLQVVVATREKSYRSTSRECVLDAGDTVDLGEIDLPFAGLRAVTEISTKADTSTGIVHLSWAAPDDTARRNFAIYRTNNPALQPPLPYETPWKVTTSNSVSDTLFGNDPFHGIPWKLDSGFQAFSYWIAVVGKDSTSPLFNTSVRVEMTSPAQQAKWKVSEENPLDLPPLANRSNTEVSPLDGGIGVLAAGWLRDWSIPPEEDTGVPVHNPLYDPFWQLDVALPSGDWNRATFARREEFDGIPVFWGKRLWRLEGRRPVTDSIARETLDSASGIRTYTYTRYGAFRSAMAFSTGDGKTWDSTEIVATVSPASRMHLEADGVGLKLVFCQHANIESELNGSSRPTEEFETTDGTVWNHARTSSLPYQASSGAASEPNPYRIARQGSWDLSVVNHYALIDGPSSDTTRAAFASPGYLEVRNSGSLLAASVDLRIGIATRPDLSDWQLILGGNRYRRISLSSDNLYVLEGAQLRRFRIR